MDQRLNGDFVDLLEGGTENVREILCLELVNETFVSVFQIHLPDDGVFIDLKARVS